jgi:rfaE bifunctional protein nucleotidyltransferase chain/domain
MDNLSKIALKIVNQKEIEKLAKELKSKGNKIVFTNGCFDILHKGHVEYLAQTADLGDVLILGLNSDNSVKRQGKGEDRPINKIDARQTVLASLFFIDYIVEFDDNTPYDLINKIKPSVLVKGGDYNPCQTDTTQKDYIVGKDIVEANEGKVEVINLVDGFSTTGLINKMKSGK